MADYVVVLTVLGERELRMPPLEEHRAEALAILLKIYYPGALVEIAHEGIRRHVSI